MTKTVLERAEAQKWLELIQILQNQVAELKDENRRIRSDADLLRAQLTTAAEWPWKPGEK